MRGDDRSAKSQKRSRVNDGRSRPRYADYRSHAHGQNELSHEHHGTDDSDISAQTSNLAIWFLAAEVLGKLKNNRNSNIIDVSRSALDLVGSYRVGRVIMGYKQVRHCEHGGVHHTGRPREEYHAELVPCDCH